MHVNAQLSVFIWIIKVFNLAHSLWHCSCRMPGSVSICDWQPVSQLQSSDSGHRWVWSLLSNCSKQVAYLMQWQPGQSVTVFRQWIDGFVNFFIMHAGCQAASLILLVQWRQPGSPLEKISSISSWHAGCQAASYYWCSVSQPVSQWQSSDTGIVHGGSPDRQTAQRHPGQTPTWFCVAGQPDSHGDAWYCDASGTRSFWAEGLHIWVPGLDSSLWCQRWRGGGNVPGLWPYWQHWTARHP